MALLDAALEPTSFSVVMVGKDMKSLRAAEKVTIPFSLAHERWPRMGGSKRAHFTDFQ